MKPNVLNPADKSRFYTVCYGHGDPKNYETPDRDFPIGSEYLDVLTGNRYSKCALGENGWKLSGGGGTDNVSSIDGGNAFTIF